MDARRGSPPGTRGGPARLPQEAKRRLDPEGFLAYALTGAVWAWFASDSTVLWTMLVFAAALAFAHRRWATRPHGRLLLWSVAFATGGVIAAGTLLVRNLTAH